MGSEIDERVPQGGFSLVTVFALPGAIAGLIFWAISQQIDYPATDFPLLSSLLIGLTTAIATYVLTVLKGQVIRATVTGILLGVVTGGLFFLSGYGEAWEMSNGFLPVLANIAIFTVALPFLRASSKGNSFFDYRPLYADAWNIPAIIGVAQVFVIVGVLLALLVAALFNFIGLGFLMDLLDKDWFYATYGGMLQGVGIGVVRQREAAILAARTVKMALLRVTAPVFAFCITIFVGAVMLRGFGSLLGDLSPMATLVAAGTAAIIMINAVVADEGRPQNVLFGATARLLGVVLLFLMALAVYGLYLRVGAEGWTPNRITAALALLVVSLYAPTYAAAALTEQWAILRQGNIAISALLIVIAVFIQTPLYQPYTWSTNSQVRIMMADPEAVADSDLFYLKGQLGEPGERAFAKLSEGDGPLAEQIAILGEAETTYDLVQRDRLDDLFEAGAITVLPDGAEVGPLMRERLRTHLWRNPSEIVLLYQDDGTVWLIINGNNVRAELLRREDSELIMISGKDFYGDQAGGVEVMEAAKAGALFYEERTYRLPTLGGQPLIEGLGRFEPFEVQADEGEVAADPGALVPETAEEGLGEETETPN